jgi:hypothetical protein
MKDKSAIIQDAQKFTAKGQLDKAISEWKKLIVDGKDGNVHNTINFQERRFFPEGNGAL